MQNIMQKKPWLFVVLLVAGVGVPLAGLVASQTIRAAHRDDVSRVIKPPATLKKIILATSSTPPSPFPHDLVVTNARGLEAFTASLRESILTQPNHPETRWQCFLTVVSSEGESYATISGGEGPSVLLDVTSGPGGGWILGTFHNPTLKSVVLATAKQDANKPGGR